jgi:hypothetical protein
MNDHIQGVPTGAAFTLKMRPTTAPFASTSKSSSFNSPDGREADARFRISPDKGDRFRTIQVYPKDLRALSVHPEPAVSWLSRFRGGAHA